MLYSLLFADVMYSLLFADAMYYIIHLLLLANHMLGMLFKYLKQRGVVRLMVSSVVI